MAHFHHVTPILRKDRDSNPGTPKGVNGFRDRPVRPLRHLSLVRITSFSFCGCKVSVFSLTSQELVQKFLTDYTKNQLPEMGYQL